MEKEDNKGGTCINQQFNIGKVGQLINGVKTVNNYFGVNGELVSSNQKAQSAEDDEPEEQRDLAAIHDEILDYVEVLNTDEYVNPEWKDKYRDLWDKILNIPEVAAKIYKIGKHKDTSFNRTLVGKIIHQIGISVNIRKPVFKKYNATHFAEKLEKEKKKDSSIRGAMYLDPPKEIKKSIEKFLDEYVK